MSEKVAYEWSGRNHGGWGQHSIIGTYVNIKVYKSSKKSPPIKFINRGEEKEGTLVKVKELKPLDVTLLGFWKKKVYRLTLIYRTVGYHYGEDSNGMKSYYNDRFTLFSYNENTIKELSNNLSKILGKGKKTSKKPTNKTSKKTSKKH